MSLKRVITEAVLEQLGHQRFVVGQSGDIIAQITRGQYAHFTSQPTGTATIIGHADDCGDVPGVWFERAKDDRQTVSPTQCRHA